MRRETEIRWLMKMCRVNVNDMFLAHLHRDFRPLAHPSSVEITSSPHVPIESPRVARSDPEATGASHSRETKDSRTVFHRCSCFAGDICGRCFSSLGSGCARWLRGSVPFPTSPAPAPVPLKSSQIVLARWYVLTRRPPRQSNAANRLLRSATHPVATSTKRYIDVHNAVNCTAAKKAQKLHPS